MVTATKKAKRPTPEQVKEYASQLPDIYRRIIAYLYDSDRERTRGDLFSLGVLRAQKSMHDDFSDRQLISCIMELEEAGFLIFDTRFNSIELTEIGEDLLEAVSGKKSKQFQIPKLPKPKW